MVNLSPSITLEDVLEHLFRQGFVEAQHRSLSYWENHSGQRLNPSDALEELLTEGAGKCPQSALRPGKPIVHLICGSVMFTLTRM